MNKPTFTVDPQNVILLGHSGSRLYGTATPTSDHDVMGVYIEAPEQIVGLDDAPKSSVHVRSQPEGVRSDATSTDTSYYDLRHFVSLAVQGNPTVVTMLFTRPDDLIVSTDIGRDLQRLAPSMISVHAGHRFVGYLDSQINRLHGKGHVARMPNRPELVARYGFDVKYVSHALRLGLQGIELLQTGSLSLPMREIDRQQVMAIKTGQVSRDDALAMVAGVRTRIVDLIESPHRLREHPDMNTINAFLLDAHRRHWGWTSQKESS